MAITDIIKEELEIIEVEEKAIEVDEGYGCGGIIKGGGSCGGGGQIK